MNRLFLTVVYFLTLSSIVMGQDARTISEDDILFQDKFIDAKGYLLLDRPDKAEPILKEIYRQNRSHPIIALEMSKLYELLGEPGRQFEFAEIAVKNAPNDDYILERFADICLETGNYQQAVKTYTKLVDMDPRSEKWTDLLALAHIKNDNREEAIRVYDQIENKIGITPDISRRKFELYDILGNTKSALKELEALTRQYPTLLQAHHLFAEYLISKGQDDKAKNVYNHILSIDRNDTKANIALMGSANTPENESNYLRALTPIIENKNIPIDNKVIELIPYVQQLAEKNDPELQSALLEVTSRLTATHTDNAKVRAIQGDVFSLSGRYEEAKKAYEKTLQLNDSNYDVWDQLMYVYTQTSDLEKLKTLSYDAIDYYPNKASAYYYHGYSVNRGGDSQKVLDLLNEGLLVAGKDAYMKSMILAELALSTWVNGNKSEAYTMIDEALTISEERNPTILEVKGDILAKESNLKEAKQYWQKAKKMGGSNISLLKKLQS